MPGVSLSATTVTILRQERRRRHTLHAPARSLEPNGEAASSPLVKNELSIVTYTFRLHLGGHEPPNDRGEHHCLAAAGRKDD